MPPSKLTRLNQFLWFGLLLSLPVTSLPVIARLFGGSNVAPMALVFLIPLVFTCLLPQTLRSRQLPAASIPLLLFFLAALISTGLAWFQNFPSYHDASRWRNNLEGILTLGTGIAFFLLTPRMIRDQKKLETSLRWLNMAGIIILAVSLMQALSWQLFKAYPPFLWDLQALVSVKKTLFIRRSTGLAMEPSWLAHQLNMLFLPLWLAMSVRGESLYKWRFFKRVSLENVLLLLALGVMFSTLSRIGWLCTGLVLAFGFFPLLQRWVLAQSKTKTKSNGLPQGLIWAGLLIAVAVGAFILLRVAAHIDPKMRAIFDFKLIGRIGLMGWLSRLSLAERFMYWAAAYQVFRLHPLLGVGLGVSGFYFPQFVPSFGYGLPEIYAIIGLGAGLPNAKNLWARLLAETGILGFILFAVWLYQLAKMALSLWRQASRPLNRALGLFGCLTLLALVVEGFSIDSFGLPYYWISFGLLVAAAQIEQDRSAEKAEV